MSFNIRETIANLIYPEGRERRAAAERAANFDDLTGLANGRAFNAARRTADADPDICVISFDVNNFKVVNDSGGHLAGDALLQIVGVSLRRAAARFGYGERIFRVGGDEFAAICPRAIAEAVRDECETEVGRRSVGGAVVSISGSVGATYAAADEGLQARKSAEKSRV